MADIGKLEISVKDMGVVGIIIMDAVKGGYDAAKAGHRWSEVEDDVMKMVAETNKKWGENGNTVIARLADKYYGDACSA